MIDSILDSIQQRFTNAVDFIFDPIWFWYVCGFGIFLVVMVIAYFVPFKWVRASLGAFLLLVGAFIAGGRVMHGEMKTKLDESRAREKAAKAANKRDSWF